MNSEAFAVLVFALLTLVVGVGALFVSEILGPRRRDPEKTTIYECGVPLFDSAHQPFTIPSRLSPSLLDARADGEHEKLDV